MKNRVLTRNAVRYSRLYTEIGSIFVFRLGNRKLDRFQCTDTNNEQHFWLASIRQFYRTEFNENGLVFDQKRLVTRVYTYTDPIIGPECIDTSNEAFLAEN